MNKNKLWLAVKATTLSALMLSGCSDSGDFDSDEF